MRRSFSGRACRYAGKSRGSWTAGAGDHTFHSRRLLRDRGGEPHAVSVRLNVCQETDVDEITPEVCGVSDGIYRMVTLPFLRFRACSEIFPAVDQSAFTQGAVVSLRRPSRRAHPRMRGRLAWAGEVLEQWRQNVDSLGGEGVPPMARPVPSLI